MNVSEEKHEAFQAGCRLCMSGKPMNETVRSQSGFSNAALGHFMFGYAMTLEVMREVDSDPYLREVRAELIGLLRWRASVPEKGRVCDLNRPYPIDNHTDV